MSRSDSWAEHRLTCMHGIREGVDSHDCAQCAALAKESGADVSNGQTYLYQKPPVATPSNAKNLALSRDVAMADIHIDYAANDSCEIQCWARGHFEPEAFRLACEQALHRWDERVVQLQAAAVEHKTWRTVRASADLAGYGVCEFIHVESKPGRGAYPVTVLADWLPLRPSEAP